MVGKKRFFNNKGTALIMVILLMAIILVLAGVLVDSSFTGYKRAISDNNIDLAYIAAESHLEIAMNYISSVDTGVILAGIPYQDPEQYGIAFVNSLDNYMENDVKNPKIFSYKVDNSSSAEFADIEIEELEFLSAKEDEAENSIHVTIGIPAIATLNTNQYKAVNKKVYYKTNVTVQKPERFFLNSAITSIGDVIVSGENTFPVALADVGESDLTRYAYHVYIDGDVSVYGSTPFYGNTKQWLYGGIFSRFNSYLKITGSAYCKSLIRTGFYDDGLIDDGLNDDVVVDRSRIDITEFSVSQGLQIFGREDKIVVYKDAYTLDDIEINGPDSVIAVNGSFFGVSDGTDEDGLGTDYHDLSSSIVNSASVHDLSMDSSASRSSRVVVNGDVFVNGGTFKLGSGNRTLGQIEDVSVAWDNNRQIEKYRTFSWNDDGSNGDEYCFDENSFLETDVIANPSNTFGFGNLFQIWSPINSDYDTNIPIWLEEIDAARETTSNGAAVLGKTGNKISGYTKKVMAANNSIKFIDRNNLSSSGIIPYTFYNGRFPDQMEGMAGAWTANKDNWFTYSSYDLDGSVSVALKDISTILKSDMDSYNAGFFVQRSTHTSTDTAYQFNHIPRKSQDFMYNNYYDYIIGSIKAMSSSKIVIGDISSNNLSDYNQINDTDYYVFVWNESQSINIDRNFNGIILSKGKVNVYASVTITGAILAAGNFYNESLNSITNLSVDNQNDIVNTNAGIHFMGYEGVSGPTRVIFDGRETLLNNIRANGGPNLVGIL